MATGDSNGFVAALDVGTTAVKCHIVDKLGRSIGKACTKVKLHYPDQKSVEINPDELWESIQQVIKEAVEDAKTTFKQILSIGISTQRSTFVTWQKDDGRHLHNFVTWKDTRATEMIEEINSSFKMKVTIRLLWILTHNTDVQKALKHNNLMYGTLETWLIYKLTSGKTYVTDISNASATGMYDPFLMDWSLLPNIVKIPGGIFPEIVDNDYDFGEVDQDIFGMPIKIGCVLGDQSASMFGSCSFNENDLKLTLGTGGFLDINTGNCIHTSLNGMYPLVGWKVQGKHSFLSEVPCHDCGSLVQWLLESELISSIDDLNKISATEANGALFFISEFSALELTTDTKTCATGFVGITPKTKKNNMIRAVLESIVFKLVLAYRMLKQERNLKTNLLVIDGGVSNNNFICQMLADLTDLNVKRLTGEIGVLGTAFVAGLSCGDPSGSHFETRFPCTDIIKMYMDTTQLTIYCSWHWKFGNTVTLFELYPHDDQTLASCAGVRVCTQTRLEM